jgi:hypothetical protein
MKNSGSDHARYRSYLLGEMPEEERLAVEERYFADEDVFAAVLAAEDELVEAHLDGTLTAGERARFERVFLATTGRQGSVLLAEALRGRMVPARTMPAFRPAIAAVVLLAVAGSLWLARNRARVPAAADRTAGTEAGPVTSPLRDVPPRSAALEASPAEAPPARASAPSVLTVILAAGLVRDAGTPNTFAVPRGTDAVRLRLRLEAGDFARYRVALQTAEGRELVAQDAVIARESGRGAALEALVPSKVLEPGTYVVIASGVPAGGLAETLGEYVFRVRSVEGAQK